MSCFRFFLKFFLVSLEKRGNTNNDSLSRKVSRDLHFQKIRFDTYCINYLIKFNLAWWYAFRF
jgi:hypothetical protein